METKVQDRKAKIIGTNIERPTKNRKNREDHTSRPNEYIGETKNQLRHGKYKDYNVHFQHSWNES